MKFTFVKLNKYFENFEILYFIILNFWRNAETQKRSFLHELMS